jgi:hypothetical protein
MGRRCRLLAATCSCAQTPGLLGLKLAWWRHGGGFLKWGYPKSSKIRSYSYWKP